MKSTKNTHHERIDAMRMKDIISQLADIIYLLCQARKTNISVILAQFTNITQDELDSLNVIFPNDTKE